MSDKYILNEDGVSVEADLMEWARWYETADRKIAKDELPNDITVSTVFLGIDLSFGEGEPLLFETMIFGGKHDEYRDRCSTKEQALAMHQKAVDLASNE